MPLVLKSLNLADAEKFLCETALHNAGSIVEASNLLGITRHALKRRIIKHNILWPIPRTGVRPGMFGPDSLLSIAPTRQPQTTQTTQTQARHSVPTVAPTRTLSPTIMSKKPY